MEAHKIIVKLFAKPGVIHTEAFVPVFHRWIQQQAVENHLLIDVADYAHVPAGPGTVLVSAEANIYLDNGENRPGLVYSRKQPTEGSFRDRLRAAVIEALKLAARLEHEPESAGVLSFATNEIQIRINDRLHAPNTIETFAAVKAEIQDVMSQLFADESVALTHRQSPHTLFEVRAVVDESAPLGTLLSRLDVAPPVAVH